jgi:hypothetical protein
MPDRRRDDTAAIRKQRNLAPFLSVSINLPFCIDRMQLGLSSLFDFALLLKLMVVFTLREYEFRHL